MKRLSRLMRSSIGVCALLVASHPLQAAPPPRAPVPPASPMPGPYLLASGLLDICEDPHGKLACTSYVVGSIDAYIYAASTRGGRRDICLPQRLPQSEDIAGIIAPALRSLTTAVPEAKDAPAAMALYLVLQDRYPCPRSGVHK